MEITGVAGMDDVLKELNRDRGYGFTYDGVITRMDGDTFSVEEVDSLLETLRMFLSFVRGKYCSLALVEGEDELGERTWVRWGAHHVESWKTGRSWILENPGVTSWLSYSQSLSLCSKAGTNRGKPLHGPLIGISKVTRVRHMLGSF